MIRVTKVLFIHHATGWGGAPVSLLKTCKALNPHLFVVHVLLLKDSVVREEFVKAGIRCDVAHSIFYKKFYRYFAYSEAGAFNWFNLIYHLRIALSWILSRYFYAKKELNRYDYDIAHLNSSVLTDWLAPASKQGKVVYHIREPIRSRNIDPFYQFIRYQVRKYADHVIAISEDNARRINLPEKTSLVYNFTETSSNPIRERSYNSSQVLFVGGASAIKGFYTVVDALPFLDNNVKICFCGNYLIQSKSRIRRNLRHLKPRSIKRLKYINKMNNSLNAKVIGLVSNVNQYIDECCCLISPFSKPHFSRPIMEAHLRKKPVIATDVIGIEEQVSHDIDGLIVEKDSAEKLAMAINKLCKNPDLCKQMGEKGYLKSVTKFSSKNVRQIEAVYIMLTKGFVKQ